jgi:hypothetical protein
MRIESAVLFVKLLFSFAFPLRKTTFFWRVKIPAVIFPFQYIVWLARKISYLFSLSNFSLALLSFQYIAWLARFSKRAMAMLTAFDW